MSDINAVLFRVLRRSWIVAIFAVLTVALVSWQVMTRPNSYQATFLTVVAPDSGYQETSERFRATELAINRTSVTTIADILSSNRVEALAITKAGLPQNAGDDYSVEVTTEPDSSVLRVLVTGPSRSGVSQLASQVRPSGVEVLADTYPTFTLSPLTSGADDTPTTSLVDVPWIQYYVLGIVVGLGVGALIALWVDSFLLYRRGTKAATPAPVRGGAPVVASGDASGSDHA